MKYTQKEKTNVGGAKYKIVAIALSVIADELQLSF